MFLFCFQYCGICCLWSKLGQTDSNETHKLVFWALENSGGSFGGSVGDGIQHILFITFLFPLTSANVFYLVMLNVEWICDKSASKNSQVLTLHLFLDRIHFREIKVLFTKITVPRIQIKRQQTIIDLSVARSEMSNDVCHESIPRNEQLFLLTQECESLHLH